MEIKKVVITGPESTGKTLLAERLAGHFRTTWIPEYAREYISGLGRKYDYTDIEHIALEQISRESLFLKTARDILFYDTHLIVTKVWFTMVYNRYPAWMDDAIKNSGTNLFLVCNTDVPWIPDNVRENGGEMREVLLKTYINEIESYNLPWKLVSGKSHQRTNCAIEIVKTHFKDNLIGIEK